MGYSGGKRGANGRSGHRRTRAPALTARPARLAAAAAAVCVIASTGALPAAAQSAASDSGAWHNTLSYIQNLQWWDHSSAWGVNNVLDQSRPFNLKGGKRIGRFEFAPVLSGRLIYDDNIFNRAQDRKGDYYAEIAPGLSVSTETARHFFNVTAGLKAYKYAKYDEFDALDRSINASAAFHVNSSHVIYATIGHALLHEDSLSYLFPDLDGTRQSRVTFNAAERTPVNATHGEAGIRRDGGRLH